MARDDVAVVEKLRLRIDGDEIADIDAESLGAAAIVAVGVDADLDLAPGDRLRVHLDIEGVAGGFQRQDGAAQGALVGEERDPCPFGEAGRPMADRHQLQPAILLDPLHRRAERVEMGDDGARRSEEHTSELQSLMRISYAVFCLKKKKREYQNPQKQITLSQIINNPLTILTQT